MDLEDIKNVWNKDNLEQTPEISLEKQKEINLPLEKIRKNMKMEFWTTAFILLFSFIVIASLTYMPFKFRFYLTMLVGSMLVVTSFYFFQFFKLYKAIGKTSLNTKDSLKDLLYRLKLNKQNYIAYYISFIPFLVCEMIIVMEFIPTYKQLSNMSFAFIFIFCVLFGLILLYFTGKIWFNYFYGKYINQIKKNVRNLE